MVNKREKKKNSLADQSVAGWSTGIDRKRVPGMALLPFVGGKIIPPLVGSLSTKKSQVSFCASVSIMSFFSALEGEESIKLLIGNQLIMDSGFEKSGAAIPPRLKKQLICCWENRLKWQGSRALAPL